MMSGCSLANRSRARSQAVKSFGPLARMKCHSRFVRSATGPGSPYTNTNSADTCSGSRLFAIVYGEPGPVAERTNLECHFIRARGPKDLTAWERARDLFARLQPDIIHFQEGVVWLRTALIGTPATKIVHIHGRYSSFHSPDQTVRQKIR